MTHPALKIKNLSFSFPDKALFEGLNIELPENEICILKGANGSGKTTLCMIISGLETEFSGNIEKPDNLLYLQQFAEANLLAATPLKALAAWEHHFGSQIPDNLRDKLMYALEWFGIKDAAEQPVWELSGGQQQRVALSALLLKNDYYWIMDEPAAGLDSAMQNRLINLIENHKSQGRGALIVTHRLALFNNSADRIFEIKDKTCLRIK